MPVTIRGEASKTEGMHWNMRKQDIIQHPHCTDFLKPHRQVILNLEDIMVAKDEALVAIQPPHQLEVGLFHGHISEVIRMITWLHNRVPLLNHQLIHFIRRGEWAGRNLPSPLTIWAVLIPSIPPPLTNELAVRAGGREFAPEIFM